MRIPEKIIFFPIYTALFLALIYLGEQIFFSGNNSEYQYIDPLPEASGNSQESAREFEYASFSGVSQQEVAQTISGLISEDFYAQQKGAKESIHFLYTPKDLQESVQDSYVLLAENFLYIPSILSKIDLLSIDMYQYSAEVRGRMEKKKIFIFGILSLSHQEFLSLLIHEFGHYYDIYSMPRTRFGDESQSFYDISWESVTTPRDSMTVGDFVSGYAMTNQYEDFSESYTYYILHNREFLEKAGHSVVLQKKYDFFRNTIFTRNQFYKENFGTESAQDYYWDITKLGIDIKKFLQYVQKEI